MRFRIRILVALSLATLTACTGSDGEEQLVTDGPTIALAAADALNEVESVTFTLTPSGAPAFIDASGAMAVVSAKGRAIVPDAADALIVVAVGGGALKTEVGAVAIGDEAWWSNPLTGEFEPLPPEFNIDPRQFFDPQNGWRPLLLELAEPTFVGEEDGLYHLSGTASAERIAVVTAGLVQDQTIPIDVWVDPVTALPHRVEFTATFDGNETNWLLELSGYNEDYIIEPPV